MKRPRKTKQWAKETVEALHIGSAIAMARDDLKEGEDPLLTSFVFAPFICAKNRKIRDKKLINEMSTTIINKMFDEIEDSPEDQLENHEFRFMLTYLDCHVYLKLINDRKQDEIMNFIVDEYFR